MRLRKHTKYSQRYRNKCIKKTSKINYHFLEEYKKEISNSNFSVQIFFVCALDEFWSYVGCKSNQCCTWYALEMSSGKILACHNGNRSDQDFLVLLKLLESFPISKFYTDSWGSYSKYIPKEKHQIGKENTWKIERRNLNFRTHISRLNRKTICFSKSEQIHDNSYRYVYRKILLQKRKI